MPQEFTIGRPDDWLLASADLWPRTGRALDVACGRGRNAVVMARAGLEVEGVDRDREALACLEEAARQEALRVGVRVLDLETGAADLGHDAFDLVVVSRYLHRPLFSALRAALRPGGLLVYETFTTAQKRCQRPRRPEFLLEPGELPHLVAPLVVLRSREGEYDGRHVASVVAHKPAE
jgi:tellurite methyltransferase